MIVANSRIEQRVCKGELALPKR